MIRCHQTQRTKFLAQLVPTPQDSLCRLPFELYSQEQDRLRIAVPLLGLQEFAALMKSRPSGGRVEYAYGSGEPKLYQSNHVTFKAVIANFQPSFVVLGELALRFSF
jgi:hypothetical protein